MTTINRSLNFNDRENSTSLENGGNFNATQGESNVVLIDNNKSLGQVFQNLTTLGGLGNPSIANATELAFYSSLNTTDWIPLELAIKKGSAETVQALINAGANVNARDKDGDMPIHVAAALGKTQVVNLLIEHDSSLLNARGGDDYTPLNIAAQYGYIEIVRALLNKGADVTAKNRAGGMPIHVAVWRGKTEVVNALLTHSPSLLNARGGDDYTPLNIAAQYGYIEIVRALLNKGADVTAKNRAGGMPIHVAVWRGKTEVVNALLTHSPSLLNARGGDDYTPLNIAAQYGYIEIVRALLNKGADVTAKDKDGDMPIHLAALSGKTQVVNLLIEHNSSLLNAKGQEDYTPLHYAADKGHTETVLALLNKGADINAKANYSTDPAGTSPSLTPLHLAAMCGNAEIVQALLNKGADINAKANSIDPASTAPSLTPLHLAATCGNAEIVQALLNKGANVNIKDKDGDMPIHAASWSGKTQVVNLLIEHNSSLINAKGHDNYTPLHWAAYKGHTETVLALLNKGADINLRNSAGQQPLGVANNEAIASLLRSHGTPRNKRAIAENLPFSLVSAFHNIRKDVYNLNAIDTPHPRSLITTKMVSWQLPQTNDVSTVGIAYNQSQELPYNNSSLAVGLNNFLSNQNIGFLHCIAEATDTSSSKAYQTLRNQGVNFIPSTEAAVNYGMHKFDLFVNKQIKTLGTEDQNRIRSNLSTVRPDIMESLARGVEFSGNKGLDDVLAMAKECFVASCLVNANVEALRQEVTRN